MSELDLSAVDLEFAERALDALLRVEGLSGREGAVAAKITELLVEAGVPADAIAHDDAHTRLEDFEVGNLVVRLPGVGARADEAPRLFSTHMDTVPLCAGAVPVRNGERIVSEGDTALGGDNRTGCASLISMLHTLKAQGLDHPPLRVLFTVGEETGLHGAREVDPAVLEGCELGFNVDGGEPARFCVGAIGMQCWEVDIEGIASHAGVFPHRGVSANLIASLAIADAHSGGWFGKIEREEGVGTSNVGRIDGGAATNEVTKSCHVTGESRSHDPEFLRQITGAYESAFTRAAAQVTNADGTGGQIRLRVTDELPGFRIPDDGPAAIHAARAAEAAGLEVKFEVADGGLDANYLSQRVPTVTFGAGQNDPHSIDEYIDLEQFRDGCRLAAALAAL